MQSIYTAARDQAVKMLNNLSTILTKAEEYATAHKIDPQVLLQGRLYPDMFHLTRQVQIATDSVRNGFGRLAGKDLLPLEDKEASFADLQTRIKKTCDYLQSITNDQLKGAGERQISWTMYDTKYEFVGEAYLLTWITPNFYFHVTTTYAILRHNGLAIGKGDYLGAR